MRVGLRKTGAGSVRIPTNRLVPAGGRVKYAAPVAPEPPTAMPKPDAKPSQLPTAEELILEEAQRMARSVQKPGQTKEQTKLIAQGIAKGIELYKKQQSAKARDRDKARKRALRLRQSETQDREDAVSEQGEWAAGHTGSGGAVALWTGGAVFAAMAAIHLWRVLAGWPLILGQWTLPSWGSLAAAGLLAALSSWFFYQAAALR